MGYFCCAYIGKYGFVCNGTYVHLFSHCADKKKEKKEQ